MSEILRVTAKVERSGGWWAVAVPEVEGVFTQVLDLGELKEQVESAVALMLDVDPSLVVMTRADVDMSHKGSAQPDES